MPPPVPARSADTTPEAERVQADLFRAVPVSRRLRIAFGLSATVIGAARRALARGAPGASARDINLRFVEVHYGTEVAEGLRADLTRRDDAHPAGGHTPE